MLPKTDTTKFKYGDRVKILHTDIVGRIIELRGPLSPEGMQIYRVRKKRTPRSLYVEVREDQLELAPKATKEVDTPKQ